MLTKQASGYSRLAANLTTDEDVRNVAFPKYHREMNRLACQALDHELAHREFNGLTVAIPRPIVPQIKEKIRKFRAELNEYLSSYEEQAEDIFQLNLQFFMLGEPEIPEESV